MQENKLQNILEAILISADKSLSVEKLLGFFEPDDLVNRTDVKSALVKLQASFEDRGFELIETNSGFRFQTREEYKHWVTQHWDEKPSKYSRALLETLALIIYRQPITRAEIEEVRGVAVSSHIIKTLQEREWIRVVGYKDLPGKPSLLGTTRQFLDYFNLKSLDEMPSLSEIQDVDKLYPELDLKTVEGDDSDKQENDKQGQESNKNNVENNAKNNVENHLDKDLDNDLDDNQEAVENDQIQKEPNEASNDQTNNDQKNNKH